jgi:hypothetical protein
MRKYYLYCHSIKETDSIFYFGIGTKSKQDLRISGYSRAFSKHLRSSFWFNVTNKHDYNVIILEESNDYKYIKQQEVKFIKLYGRRDLDLGDLVNLTDGGEGTSGVI